MDCRSQENDRTWIAVSRGSGKPESGLIACPRTQLDYIFPMPSAVIPTSVQFEPEVRQEVVDYQRTKGISSFSKALMAMLAERRAMLVEGRK
jgi:hypothetical protein